MRSALHWLVETTGALFALLRLGVQTRFRFRGAYWGWRRETAFGGGEPPKSERRKMILDYARWVWRMRRYQ